METFESFFAEFPPVSKEAWLDRIARDLKGKPIDALYWQLNDSITVDPFGHADDLPAPAAPLTGSPGSWELCETVDLSTPEAPAHTLQALQAGTEGLEWQLDAFPEGPVFEAVLEGVYLDMIGLHFSGKALESHAPQILGLLEQEARKRNLSGSRLSGSLVFDPLAQNGRPDWGYAEDLVAHARRNFPNFRVLAVQGRPAYGGPAGAPAEIAAVLRRGNTCLEQLSRRGLSPDVIAATLQVELAVGTSYFVEIAKLRALRLLWINMLKAWGAPLHYPAISVHFHPDVYTDTIYTNMIRATTMAMSAVLGGASRLTVLPYDAGREDQSTYGRAFAHRIARNVQHLLKMESGLEEVNDPAAGSYYLEKLTRQLATAAWADFSKQPTVI